MSARPPVYMLRSMAFDATRVIAVVGKFYGVAPADILGRSRRLRIAWARHVVTYLATALGATQRAASEAVHRKDHGSAWLSCKRVRDAVDVYPEVRKEIEELEAMLK